ARQEGVHGGPRDLGGPATQQTAARVSRHDARADAGSRPPRTSDSGQRAAGSGQRRTARIRCSARKRLIRFYFVAFAVLILSQLPNAFRLLELLYSREKHTL